MGSAGLPPAGPPPVLTGSRGLPAGSCRHLLPAPGRRRGGQAAPPYAANDVNVQRTTSQTNHATRTDGEGHALDCAYTLGPTELLNSLMSKCSEDDDDDPFAEVVCGIAGILRLLCCDVALSPAVAARHLLGYLEYLVHFHADKHVRALPG